MSIKNFYHIEKTKKTNKFVKKFVDSGSFVGM